MYSTFDTGSDAAGFRLQYMEIYNWGTFNKKVFRINPLGNNSLLTGANASGKSTLVDALLTLLVPLKKDIFYNQSSGVGKKGDRTDATYVLGHYGNQQEEGVASTTSLRLRDKKTYSVILASFANTEQKIITLFQVRWFANDELKTVFGISREPLEIRTDFFNFDSKGVWKKVLEQKYNANSTKKRIEFCNGPTEYGEKIVVLLGMREKKALSLFNQIVGVKVLSDLDDFIRTNMLEEKDAENEYVDLIRNFDELMSAKINIDKTKEQIVQLEPIDEIANVLFDIQKELDELQQLKEMAVYWFTKKKVELAQKELEKSAARLEFLNEELEKLKQREKELKDRETDLTVQIKTDTVGNRIEKLKTEIRSLEKNRGSRLEKLETYNQIALKVGFAENPNEDAFIENREDANTKKNEFAILRENKAEELRQGKNRGDEIQRKIDANIETIQSLQKYKNNIIGREAEIREEILRATGATADEIPFIGELIRVKDDERTWELSIEKILHTLAMRLIVPDEYYAKVNEYVNTNNLRGRIVYQRYREFNTSRTRDYGEKQPNSLLNKIEFKPNNIYADWLEDIIYHQYNYACVNNLHEFNHYDERAVTKEGLIKSTRGRHEKDDRPHVMRQENYVLGWSNQGKIRLVQVEVRKLQEEQQEAIKQIRIIEKSIKETDALKDDFFKLVETYTRYDDIDWQSYAKTIQEKVEEKTKLEVANDIIHELQKQLEKVQADLEQLSGSDIANKSREIFQTEEKIRNTEEKCAENSQILEQLGEIDVTLFESENVELQNISYQNIAKTEKEFQVRNIEKIKTQTEIKTEHERKAAHLINSFKNPPQEITDRFHDWRSDVNHLPDSEHLELIAEYQSYYTKLKDEDLVRFEKKFNEYLRETITNKVSAFRMFFVNWEDSIKKAIKDLNDSLKSIDFNHTPTTYIQLVATRMLGDEATDFRNLLNSAIPKLNDTDATIEGRKEHFENHIEPLIEKLKTEQWRKKVMEVRAWFTYKAEEFYKETETKKQTYESMGQLSGGEKAQLTYTILGSAIAYQFGLTNDGVQSNSFRFIAIDEAFKSQDEDKARYLLSLCKQLQLQLLVVTPSDNIHIVQDDISIVHYVERSRNESILRDLPIEQFTEEREKFMNG
ncbi:MAG: hypothetical protein LBV41_09320 [Cytophagaceae bacterium]|jgi:uncharacterized protein YPO0396|nr:hypothetical protein [Cytophagaceae bacterium]